MMVRKLGLGKAGRIKEPEYAVCYFSIGRQCSPFINQVSIIIVLKVLNWFRFKSFFLFFLEVWISMYSAHVIISSTRNLQHRHSTAVPSTTSQLPPPLQNSSVGSRYPQAIASDRRKITLNTHRTWPTDLLSESSEPTVQDLNLNQKPDPNKSSTQARSRHLNILQSAHNGNSIHTGNQHPHYYNPNISPSPPPAGWMTPPPPLIIRKPKNIVETRPLSAETYWMINSNHLVIDFFFQAHLSINSTHSLGLVPIDSLPQDFSSTCHQVLLVHCLSSSCHCPNLQKSSLSRIIYSSRVCMLIFLTSFLLYLYFFSNLPVSALVSEIKHQEQAKTYKQEEPELCRNRKENTMKRANKNTAKGISSTQISKSSHIPCRS
ncbi:hypothetical protein VP01_330g1 [Puccinia sorghi]|uniref:Uncharacterized protein n=1 Tax=Puccinia sorghi TaxID=27349 RepID=A0A0L6UXB0_9BASI|nr:hypothetical protein VP01_330g1 [Puccinia sorghi]